VVEAADGQGNYLMRDTSEHQDTYRQLLGEQASAVPSITSTPNITEEATGPQTDIPVQITNTVFLSNAAFMLVICIVGFIPWWILNDYSVTHKGILTASSGGAMLILYVLLIVRRGLPHLLCWQMVTVLFLGFLATFLGSLGPLQLAVNCFCQSAVIIVVAFFYPQTLATTVLTGILGTTSLAVWLITLYAALARRSVLEWVEYGVNGVLVLIIAVYNSYQTDMARREVFSVSREDRIQAVIKLYTDVVMGPIGKIRECCRSTTPDLSLDFEEL